MKTVLEKFKRYVAIKLVESLEITKSFLFCFGWKKSLRVVR